MLTMKKLAILAFLLSAAFALSACGSTDAANPIGRGPGMDRRPDFGQPDREADVSGIVKSISGNSVTVLKIDRPASGRMGSSTNEVAGEGTATRQGSGNMMLGPGGRTGGQGGGTRFVAGGRPGGEDNEESRAAMLARLKEMSSGEETVTIPVGIQMLKPDTTAPTDQRPTMIEATLTDITADKMITVWLDGSVTDRKVASFVMITR